MNGSLKWFAGIASALVVAVVGWLFHTVNDLQKTVATQQNQLTEIKEDQSKEHADIVKADDEIDQIRIQIGLPKK